MKKLIRIAALDIGDVRIGVAISDDLLMFAHPLTTIKSQPIINCFKELLDLLRKKSVAEIIIGLPRNAAGELGEQARKTLHFALRFRRELSNDDLRAMRILFWDERFSSQEALSIKMRNRPQQKAKNIKVDEVSAALILESYLSCLRGLN